MNTDFQKRCLALGGVFSAQVAQVAPDPPGDQDHSGDPNEKIEAMKPNLQGVVFVPFLAEFLPNISETETQGNDPAKV